MREVARYLVLTIGAVLLLADLAHAQTGTGLNATYYAGADYADNNLRLYRLDASVDFTWLWWWAPVSPDPTVPENFSARWTGKVKPAYTQTYTFYTTADDGVRLWVDDVLLIDQWHGVYGATQYSATISLTANVQYPIKLEFYDGGYDARIRLEWSSASQPRQVIPAARLFPTPFPAAQETAAGVPGSSSYPHASCAETKRDKSGWPTYNDDLTYWTYEPRNPTPATAPLVVFNHGWLAYDPVYYMRWLTHLCRKGNVVVFPKYQNLFTHGSNFTPNAILAVKDAIAYMSAFAVTKPQTSLGMVVIGHSAGGTIAANMANRYAAEGLPTPKAVMPLEPCDPAWCGVPYDASLAGIPTNTYLDCLVGDADTVVGRGGCDAIWSRTTHMQSSRRNYVWMFSDAYGDPDELADHYQNTSTSTLPKSLEYRGLFKLGDALRDCGLFGSNCSYANGNTANQRSLGNWSDGVAVRELSVTTTVPACPSNSTAAGC